MGTNNRERRRAKVRQRQRRQDTSSFSRDDRSSLELVVGQLVSAAIEARVTGREAGFEASHRALVDAGLSRQFDALLFALLQRVLPAAWQGGWQPSDLVRLARRSHGAPHGRMLTDVVTAELRGYAAATVDRRWTAQLSELGGTVWWGRDDEYLTAVAAREGLDRGTVIRWVLDLFHVLYTLPQIQLLGPPPGQARQGSLAPQGNHEADPRLLERVRGLLAKAEATGYPEEAESYTAKAQELMARHSIDYALLAATRTGAADEPLGRRIWVDNPYEAPKVLLLEAVARANHCLVIWSSNLGFATVLGFESDADGVELLFTSLLVQATTAMVRAGSQRDAHGRSSTRSFRQSFLTAYAQRIGERLTAATRQATEQATRDLAGQPGAERLLPVLASRDSAVDDLANELFPELVSRSVTISNRAGWVSGRAAADHAQLGVQRSLDAEPSP